jgi:hypothetical protein
MKIPGMLTIKVLKAIKDSNDIDDRVKDIVKVLNVADKVSGSDPKKLDKRDFSGIFGNDTTSAAEKKLDAVEANLSRVLSEKMDWPEKDGEVQAFERMVQVEQEFGQQGKEMKGAVKAYAQQLALTTMSLNNIMINLAAARAGIPARRRRWRQSKKFAVRSTRPPRRS